MKKGKVKKSSKKKVTKTKEVTKLLSPKEFIKGGYAQEINRRFLHPLGLNIKTIKDGDTSKIVIEDKRLRGTGVIFSKKVLFSQEFEDNIEKIKREEFKANNRRIQKYGFVQQFVPDDKEEQK